MLDFYNTFIEPKPSRVNSRQDVNLWTKYRTFHSDRVVECVPIMAANLDTVGTFAMADKMATAGMLTCLHKFYLEPEIDKFLTDITFFPFTFLTFGMSDRDLISIERFVKKYGDDVMISLDVANGYITSFFEFVHKVREIAPLNVIMAGNVATYDGAANLFRAGADIIKVGLGSGALCTTRLMTGVGVPQLEAVYECQRLEQCGALLCSDGGIRHVGDIAKAFAVGANYVMLGSFLAGHDECDGEWGHDDEGNKIFHQIYGMASQNALDKYGKNTYYRTSEGLEDCIPYKGSVTETLRVIEGGLRSTCTYTDCASIEGLRHVKLVSY